MSAPNQAGPARPETAELNWIAAQLASLEDLRRQLLARRLVLLAELARPLPPEAPATGAVPAPAPPAVQAPPWAPLQPAAAAPAGAGARPRRAEMSRRAVAFLLLAAGGLLVVIAAAVFTAANWSSIGPAGRLGILLAVSALVLAAPWPLARRGLTATGEAVAAVGLALTIADAALLARLSGVRESGPLAAAAACAALAVAWAAYGHLAPARGPRLAAIGIAQLVLPLAGAAVTVATPAVVALALAVTAAGDLALAARAGKPAYRAERLTARAAAVAAWSGAVLVAAIDAAAAQAVAHPGVETWLLAVVFLVAGAIGVLGMPATRTGQALAGLAAGASGALFAIGLALPGAAALPGPWQIAVFAAAGAVIAAAAFWHREAATGEGPSANGAPAAREAPAADAAPAAHVRLAASWGALARAFSGRAGQLAGGGIAVLAVTALAVTPAAVTSLLYPLTWLGHVWSGMPSQPRPGFAPAATWPGSLATPAVLALASLVCWLAPAIRLVSAGRRAPVRAAALALAGLAGAAVPLAGGLPGWGALVTLTAAAAGLLAAGSVFASRLLASGEVAGGEVAGRRAAGEGAAAQDAAAPGTASPGAASPGAAGTVCAAGLVVAVSAALWSLTGPAATIAELAVLLACLAGAAAAARARPPAVLTTGGALAALTGLAGAAALASGLPAADAAFAVLGAGIVATGLATVLHKLRPTQALVLEAGTGPVLVLAAAMAAQRADAFSVLAATVAILASATAWLRAGRRRAVTLVCAAIAGLAAVVPQLLVLTLAALAPYRQFAWPWRGLPAAPSLAAGWSGLPLALAVLAACMAAAVVAAGAWRGRAACLGMLAVALPLLAAPAGVLGVTGGPGGTSLASGPRYAVTVAVLLALTLALTGWAVAASRSAIPAWAALAAASLALGWALATSQATLVVLGALAAAWLAAAWRARLAGVRAGAAAASVAAGCAFAECAALAAGLPAWQAALPALAVAAAAQAAAARLAGSRPALALAAETAGWVAAVAVAVPGMAGPGHAATILTATGALCLGVAVRPGRRFLLWLGLAQGEAALCIWLAMAGVHAPEPYTVPAAVAVIAAGWLRMRRFPQAGSWLCYGPGLALALLPSLVAAWQGDGWLRPLVLGLVAAGITLAGARGKLAAPLLLGAGVAVLDAGHELAPAVTQLAAMVPRWVPIAVIGVLLLAVGATYEARLRDLRKLRTALSRLR